MPRPHLTPGKDPVPIVQEAGWASGPVWTGAENLAPPGFDPRTIEPVGSRYTDYATRSTSVVSVCPILAIMGHRNFPKHFLFPIQGTSFALH
jgi:hypothetical protein